MSAHPSDPLILVIEDDPQIQALLRAQLERRGYRVVAADEGVAGLKCLREGARPQLILLDLLMPGMDGFEFRRRQLADAALAGIPVIVLSAVSHSYRAANLLEALAYFEKP